LPPLLPPPERVAGGPAVAPAVRARAPPSPASAVHPSPAEEPARGGAVGERALRRVRQPPQQEGAAVEHRDRGVVGARGAMAVIEAGRRGDDAVARRTLRVCVWNEVRLVLWDPRDVLDLLY
jgi:hypothetical protein